MTTAPGIFAVSDQVEAAGGLVYWRLAGGLDPAALLEPWEDVGLDPALLPKTPAPATALARALKEQTSKHVLLRPLATKGGAHAGWALVDETMLDEDLSHAVSLAAKLDAAGRPAFSDASDPRCAKIVAAYEKHLERCSSEDVGAWLVKLMGRLEAVSMRDQGGIYYLPPWRLPTWNTAAKVIAAMTSSKLFVIPALRSADAVNAILDAVSQEAEAEAAILERDLEDEKLRARALETRGERAMKVEKKLDRYEAFLGLRLEGLRERLATLRGNLAAAALARGSEDDEVAA